MIKCYMKRGPLYQSDLKRSGSRPAAVLLSQLLMVPLPQLLLGHVGRERRQEPPQGAGAVEGVGPELVGRSPVHQLRHSVFTVAVSFFTFTQWFTSNPPGYYPLG